MMVLRVALSCPDGCRCSSYKVWCWGANLQDMPRGLLNTTQLLQVNTDNITQLNQHVVDQMGLFALKQLALVEVKLTRVTNFTFASLHLLEQLLLKNNNISAIEAETFQGLHRLHELHLSHNNITTVAPGAFHGLLNVRFLDLSNNKIKNITRDMFDGMRHEACNWTYTNSSLDMSRNIIQYIAPDAFRGLCAFKNLYLNYNSLKVIQNNTFHGLSRLNNLYLISFPNYIEMQAQAMHGLDNLLVINLPKNNFYWYKFLVVSLDFLSCKSLSSLRLLSVLIEGRFNLKRGQFQALTSLEYLDLLSMDSYHSEQELNNNVFEGLESLKSLILKNNRITTLQPHAFSGLQNLLFLDLRDNHISLFNNPFSNLVKLLELDLGSNKAIHSVDRNTFQGLTSLRKLNIQYMRTSNIETGAFQSLSRLNELKLQIPDLMLSGTSNELSDHLQVMKTMQIHVRIYDKYQIGAAATQLLQEVRYLRELTLIITNLRFVPDFTGFAGSNFSKLDIINGDIPVLKSNFFRGLSSLKSLWIQNSKTERIETGAFNHLPLLEALIILNNNIKIFQAGIFNNLPNLRRLHLADNNANTIQYGVFHQLPALTDLSLASNRLTEIPANIFMNLTSLTQLTLVQCCVQNMKPGTFYGLTSLTFFAYEQHDKEYYNRNEDKLEPGVFKGLVGIKKLFWMRSNIKELIPDVFDARCQDDDNITCANITQVERFCDVTHALTTLEELFLRNNNITYIHPYTFLHCTRLHTLYLRENHLLTLATPFLHIPALRRLDLVNCNVSVVPDTAFQCSPHLSTIDFRNNNIKTINITALSNLQSLTTVFLNRNPIVCDCKLLPVWTLFHERHVTVLNTEDYSSGYPSIPSDTFNPPDNTSLSLICDYQKLLSLDCNSSILYYPQQVVSDSLDFEIFKLYIEPLVFILIFLCGLLGNGFLLYVLLRHSEMHTAANAFIINLACTDILSLVVNLPLSYCDVLHVTWELGTVPCKLFMVARDLTVSASVFSVVALSLQRFLVVRSTHRFTGVYFLSERKTTGLLLLLAWGCALGSAMPAYVSADVRDRCLYCLPQFDEYVKRTWTSQLVVYCLIPAILITAFNGGTAYILYERIHNIPGEVSLHVERIKNRKKIAKIALVLAFIFIVSYVPNFILRVLVTWSLVDKESIFLQSFFTYCFFFLNSIANPICLIIMSNNIKACALKCVKFLRSDDPPDSNPAPLSGRELELQEIRRARIDRIDKLRAQYR